MTLFSYHSKTSLYTKDHYITISSCFERLKFVCTIFTHSHTLMFAKRGYYCEWQIVGLGMQHSLFSKHLLCCVVFTYIRTLLVAKNPYNINISTTYANVKIATNNENEKRKYTHIVAAAAKRR